MVAGHVVQKDRGRFTSTFMQISTPRTPSEKAPSPDTRAEIEMRQPGIRQRFASLNCSAHSSHHHF